MFGSNGANIKILAGSIGFIAYAIQNSGLIAISQISATYDCNMTTTSAWPETVSVIFYTYDLWSVDLQGADVIFYGLTPIME